MELILNTFGCSLSRDNDCFIISHTDGKQRIPTIGIRSIQISKGASISSDAVLLAIENEIDIVFCTNAGNPVGRIWSSKYGSISTIRKNQVDFTLSSCAVEWIKDIIKEKIENQQALLLSLNSYNINIENQIRETVQKLEDYRCKIESLSGNVVPDIAAKLRGWEGLASQRYFQTINISIPEEYKFETRSQHPALDVVNALLNYGYGILYGKIEGALIKAGIDPYVGVFHRDDYNRPVLVFDIIEKYRVWVDYVVISITMQKIISEEYYSIKENGSCWLEGLGRRILIQSMNDFLDEIIAIKGVSRSRLNHIELYAQSLAQTFKNFKPSKDDIL